MEIILKNVRLSFPDLRQRGRPPKDKPNEPGKYGCQGIFEPESDAHVTLRNAVVAEAKAKWGDNYAAIVGGMANDKKCLRKGDFNLDAKGNVRDGYKGQMYVKASNPNPVPLIGARAKNADGTWNILPPESGKPYGGCYVNLKIDVYASTKHGNAVHATLQAVQFVKDGESFGGAPATADGFGDVEGAAEEDAASMEGFGDDATVGSSNSDLGL